MAPGLMEKLLTSVSRRKSLALAKLTEGIALV
jgi:hypothetical protein